MNPLFLSQRYQRGVGLIEVLISTLILSIGLLGIAALQANALKNSQSSLTRSQVVMLSYFMLDAMRVNRAAAINGSYNLGKTCTIVADAGNIISHDQHVWLQAIKENLGDNASTCGEVTCQGNDCVVRIYWDDSRGTSGSADQMIETRTRL
ncbi:MAG: type IV pilus modification protein PilV [Pseudomonadota bacterium]|jgi:type IV pilus assembly protein PilV